MSNFSFSEETKELFRSFGTIANILEQSFMFENAAQAEFWSMVNDKIDELLEE